MKSHAAFAKNACLNIAAVALLCAGAFCHGADFMVNTTVDRADPDLSDSVCGALGKDASCSLRAAVQNANLTSDFDVISLPAGIYRLTLTGAREDAAATGDLDVREPLSIQAVGAERPVIDGINKDRVFDVMPGTGSTKFFLHGVQVRQGLATFGDMPSGGAIYVRGTSALRTDDCIFDRNVAQYGGAIAADVDAELRIDHSHFQDNWNNGEMGLDIAGGGAAIHADHAWVDIVRSSFIGNGIGQLGSTIYSSATSINVEDSTIADNAGDGLRLELSAARLRNATLAGNGGYGFRVYSSMSEDVIWARNSIIAQNGIADCDFIAFATGDLRGHNLDSDNSCSLERASGGLPGVRDPGFGALQTIAGVWFHPLMPGSAAIDAGSRLPLDRYNFEACTDADQVGDVRLRDGDGDMQAICDLGAVER